MSIPTHVPPLRLFTREDQGSHWEHRFPAGTLREHVLDPRVWGHVARKLRRFDTITALAEDGSFDIQLRVLAVDPQGMWAQTAILRERACDAIPTLAADRGGFIIEYSGPQLWRIRRGEDLVAEGLPTEAAAEALLARLRGSKPTEAVAELETEQGLDGYSLKFAGPHKWRILRHGNLVEEMLPTKGAAEARLAEIRAESVAA